MVRGILVVAAMFAAIVAAITLVAAEAPEVVVLSTRRPDGTLRRTRVWIADADGASWIEAATPDREFLADLRRDPTVMVERDGRGLPYVATPVEDGHARIRRLIRDKYGWADWWIQHLTDTSQSVAVRLDPPRNFIAPR